MAIELNAYGLTCKHCGEEVEFEVQEIEGLSRDIESECDEAARIAERETEGQFAGMIDPDDHPIQPRTMHDLAAAIRRGDVAEAEILLSRVADDLGEAHRNAIQIGRFSLQARRAA